MGVVVTETTAGMETMTSGGRGQRKRRYRAALSAAFARSTNTPGTHVVNLSVQAQSFADLLPAHTLLPLTPVLAVRYWRRRGHGDHDRSGRED